MHPSNRSNGFAEEAFCADASTTPTNKNSPTLNETMQYRKIIADAHVSFCRCRVESKKGTIRV
jgi:hypothetical protein